MRVRLFLKSANRWFAYRRHHIFRSAGDNVKDKCSLSLSREKVFISPMTIPPLTDVDVLFCQTCRRADMPDQAVRPCVQLQAKLDNAGLHAGVRVHGVDCLSNCKNGCTIVLQAAARWTYIPGNINQESDFEQLCEGIAGYSDSEDGIVPWKQRVALFRKNSIARIPPKAKTD